MLLKCSLGIESGVYLCVVVLELGNGMQVSGGGLPGTYRTIQLHFHWGSVSSNGSEHTLDNLRFPMEVWGFTLSISLSCMMMFTLFVMFVYVCAQMHIVNIKSTHPNLTSALEDPTGLAVLGVFVDVRYCFI